MRFWQRLYQQLALLWQGMSVGRRVAFGLVTGVCVAAVVGVVYWAAQPDYRVLFSGLAPEDAGPITAKLQSQNVPFHLTNGGGTILVPADQVQQLRLDLAVEGLPSKGGKGFELFDGSQLGLTPFLQHVNYTRALQAELARTIMQLEPVAQARVHITRPEPSPFVRDQKPVTASVVLKLKTSATMSRSLTSGLVAMVARSVEGLKPENVTVLDTAGHILSDPHAGEANSAPSSQLEYRREVESELARKAEEVLAMYLGQGRSIVRVTADINFKQLTETRKTYDPEQRAVTHETLRTHKAGAPPPARGVTGSTPNLARQPPPVAAGAGTTDNQEDSEVTYAPSMTEQVRVEGTGNVERLTVAALVDLAPKESGAGATSLTVKEAQEIIKQAVGFKTGRDEIKVSDVRLAGAVPVNNLEADWAEGQRWQNYANLARQVSLGVAAVVALLLGWLFLRRLRPATPAPKPEEAEQPQATEGMATSDSLSSLAQQDPEAIARLLTRWLEEPAGQARRAA